MQINVILPYLFPNANPSFDWEVSIVDGEQKITGWFLPDPQPTEAEMQAVEADAIADRDAKKAAKEAQKADLDARAKQKLGFTDEEYDFWRKNI